MLKDVISDDNFNLSNYLIELSKQRRRQYRFSDIKNKLSISDYQLESIENGNIQFMPFPYNYHITKQYVNFLAPKDVFKVKKDFFSMVKKIKIKSNTKINVQTYTYTKLNEKVGKN